MALLGGDLLGAVLVDRVVVGGPQRLAVAEVDLVLAEVALALRVLDRQPGGRPSRCGSGGSAARPARCRAASSRRCRGWPARGRGSRFCQAVLVGVVEDDELELGAGVGDQAALGEPRELAAQDLARRGDDLARRRPTARSASSITVPSCHGIGRSVVEVGLHHEVAVAAAPTRPSRSRRPSPCRRRRRAGSCSPRRRARAPRRGSAAAVSRLPCSRPSMSAIASSTVSTVPSATAFLSSSSVTRRRRLRPRVRLRRAGGPTSGGAPMLRRCRSRAPGR